MCSYVRKCGRMKNKSKLLAFLCVPFMLLGCSGKGEDSGNTTPPDNSSENNNNNNNNENNNNQGGNEQGGGQQGGNEQGGGQQGGQTETPHTHSWSTSWYFDNTQHWHPCTDPTCNGKNDVADHQFGDWVIDSYQETVVTSGGYGQSGTEVRNGQRHRICSICNYRDVKNDVNYPDPNKYNNPTEPFNAKYARDYHIFDKAPDIKFTIESDPKNPNKITDKLLDFATKPNKSKGGGDPWEVGGKFTVSNCPDQFKMTNVGGTMKVRGNYTTDYEKKGFRLKFDSKDNFLGLNNGNKYKKWVVFADVKDNSMLRNALSFYMAKKMLSEGSKVFVTDFCPVHIYINDNYWGLYLLAEQKEMGQGRILNGQVSDTSGTNIKYTFELDKYAPEEAQKASGDPTFTMTYSPAKNNEENQSENRYQCNGDIQTYTMLDDDYTTEQVDYLQARLEKIYTVMYNATHGGALQEINEAGNIVNCAEGTSLEECLSKVVDMDSFVDMYLFNELVVNPDIGYSSFYLSLDMSNSGSKKLMLDNPWDFDSALGVTNKNGPVKDSKGLYAANSSNMWLAMIADMPFFKDKCKARWNQYREAEVFEKGMQMIEDYSYSYKGEYARNFDRWPKTMGNNPETNYEVRSELQQYKTEKQAETFLYNWFGKRVDYLESVFGTNRVSILDGSPNTNTGEQGQGGGGQTQPVDYTAFKAAATKVRLEAEDGTINGNSVEKKDRKTNSYDDPVSGAKYVGGLDAAGGSVTFTYNAAKTTEALLSIGLSKRTSRAYTISDLFDITVNGQTFSSTAELPQGNGTDYHIWTTVDAGKINLSQGQNTLVFTAKQTCTNFDYIDLYIPN